MGYNSPIFLNKICLIEANFPHPSGPALGPTQPHIQVVPGHSWVERRLVLAISTHPHLKSSLRKCRAITLLLYAFMAVHRVNFWCKLLIKTTPFLVGFGHCYVTGSLSALTSRTSLGLNLAIGEEIKCVYAIRITKENYSEFGTRITTNSTLFPLWCLTSPYGASRSHSLDTPHSVELLWKSDQPEAKSNAPEDGQNCCPKHVELIWIYQ